MWEKLTLLERLMVGVMVMGSIVDIFQFVWIIKKGYGSLTKKGKKKDIMFPHLQDKDE